jgi:hypothetical protein
MGDICRKRTLARFATASTADCLHPVLGHDDRQRGQVMDLTPLLSKGWLVRRKRLLAVTALLGSMRFDLVWLRVKLQRLALVTGLATRLTLAFAAQALGSFLLAAFVSTGWPVGIPAILIQQGSEVCYLLLGSLQGGF